MSDYRPWKTVNKFEVLLFFSNMLVGYCQKNVSLRFSAFFGKKKKKTKNGGRHTEEILLGKSNGT